MRVMRRSAVPIPKADPALGDLVATVDYALAATTAPERKWREVYELLFERLCDFAARYLGPDAAEDAVQDAMWSMWRRRNTVFARTRNTWFFFRVVLGRIASMQRREQRRLVRLDTYRYYLETFYANVPSADADVEHAEFETVIDETVDAMPARCRTVWLLAHEQDMSYNEIAQTLGIAPGTVRRHMSRAQELLRDALTDAGYRERPRLPAATVPKAAEEEFNE
jgi:RNA polymerase sigma-70 factor (ECF subfamily)